MTSNTLTNDEIEKIARKISEPTFHFMRKLIIDEFGKFDKKNIKIDSSLPPKLIISSLVSLDSNVLMMIKKIIDKSEMPNILFDKLFELYLKEIKNGLNKIESLTLKEKIS